MLLQTDKSSVGGKKTTNESPTLNMGNFHFVVTQSWQAIPHGFTWVLKESPSFSTRRFGLFHDNSSINGDSYDLRRQTIIFPRKN